MFALEAPELGDILKIVIEHDNSGPKPAWYLEKVMRCEGHWNMVAEGDIGRWLFATSFLTKSPTSMPTHGWQQTEGA